MPPTIASSKPKKPRRSNKRTQASPTPSSSSTSSAASSTAVTPAARPPFKKQASSGAARSKLEPESPPTSATPLAPSSPVPRSATPAGHLTAPTKADFETWYLRMATLEMGADLEKLRDAQDFRDASVPILIRALRQGAEVFTEEERGVVLGRR